MVHTSEADKLVCKSLTKSVIVSKSVFNGQSFVSARPPLQPCVSVLIVQEIKEYCLVLLLVYSAFMFEDLNYVILVKCLGI